MTCRHCNQRSETRRRAQSAVQRQQAQARPVRRQCQQWLRHHHRRGTAHVSRGRRTLRSPRPPTVTATRPWSRWRAGAVSAARAISTAPISRPTPGRQGLGQATKDICVSDDLACADRSPDRRRQAGHDRRPHHQRTLRPQCRVRLVYARTRDVRRAADGARHALRLCGRVDRDPQAAVVARGGVRLRRQVPARQQGLRDAEADPEAVPRADERRRLRQGPAFRGQILRHGFRCAVFAQSRGRTRADRRLPPACARGIRPRAADLGQLLRRARRTRRRKPRQSSTATSWKKATSARSTC